MATEAILDLCRADAVSRRSDDIVVAPDELEIAVLVDDALIARRHPFAEKFFARCIGLAPILQEHHRVRPFDRDLAKLAGPARRAVRTNHRDAVPGHRFADGAGTRNGDSRAGG